MIHNKLAKFAITPKLLLLLFLCGCSSSSSDDDDFVSNPVPPDIVEENGNLPPEGSVEGVWATACFFDEASSSNFYQINTYKRVGAETFYIERYYENSDCSIRLGERLVIGTTEEVGTVIDPVFGVIANSVLVTISSVWLNASLVDPLPEPFFDLIYRSGSTLTLGLPGSEDPVTSIPEVLNWNSPFQYIDL